MAGCCRFKRGFVPVEHIDPRDYQRIASSVSKFLHHIDDADEGSRITPDCLIFSLQQHFDTAKAVILNENSKIRFTKKAICDVLEGCCLDRRVAILSEVKADLIHSAGLIGE